MISCVVDPFLSCILIILYDSYFQVTFREPAAAMRACVDPSPVIDGRRANCNLASLGAHRSTPTTPPHGTVITTIISYHSSTPSLLVNACMIMAKVPVFQLFHHITSHSCFPLASFIRLSHQQLTYRLISLGHGEHYYYRRCAQMFNMT